MLQTLDLETMVLWSKEKLREGVEGAAALGRPVHTNFSGGVDSSALKDLVERTFPTSNIPVVFSDTGVEFTELARFARGLATHIVKPEIFFHEVVKHCGYPAIGKTQARYLHDLQNPTDRNESTRNLRMNGIKQDGSVGASASRLSRKYLYLVKGPKIGDGCCHHLKEKPLDDWAKAHGGSIPIIGVQAEESDRRRQDWLNYGCVGLKKKTPKISPFMIWTKSRVLEYILKYNVPYCRKVYGNIVECEEGFTTTGEKRTGCTGCLFGILHDPLRFCRLYVLDRPKWEYFMRSGAKEVLEWLGIPAYPGQYGNLELDLCPHLR
jgi:3'-phosphoadenosine 5'-phosphosulfate sulfotransferase (PAPS reductase)/FAD synthetase